jgi:hypothetical protein
MNTHRWPAAAPGPGAAAPARLCPTIINPILPQKLQGGKDAAVEKFKQFAWNKWQPVGMSIPIFTFAS